MKVKHFEGSTEQAVIEQVKNELGPQAIIVSIKTIRARGLIGVFKKPRVEVTAAYEEPGEILREDAGFETDYAAETKKPANAAEAKKTSNGAEAKKASAGANAAAKPGSDETEASALKENQAFAAGLKDMYKDRMLEEQAEKIRILEKNVLTAQEMMARMSGKLAVERHKASGGGRRYKNNIIQVFFDTLLEQGVTEQTAMAVLDELDIDFTEGAEGLDIDAIVKMVYGNVIGIIGKPGVANVGAAASAADKVTSEAETKPEATQSKTRKRKPRRKPFVAAFIGPTGVGKTTTIAKLSADFVLNKNLPVSLISADTYRIAAVEQLRTYADILSIDLGVVYSPEDMAEQIHAMSGTKDVILIDTAGRSHRHGENMDELRALLEAAKDSHKYLVLSLTTKFEDMLDIVNTYAQITDFNIIFTKLDETKTLGAVLNLCHATGKTVSYITFGQNVPNDIRILQPEEIARAILCGI